MFTASDYITLKVKVKQSIQYYMITLGLVLPFPGYYLGYRSGTYNYIESAFW